ncbi:complex I NDUFA9 subunit family protein [Halogranum rubrum]|uniref:Nucleoside-diphosphate sugar epimerase n=1 Tax=Halogranum salarium B-1 TaxID=1210908 RepID=J2ZZX1_9EURY|nr:complex I NDUFA9 subunit family protein [Halogranum salarium]EJN58598.1 nucleoside-diphosphate sugar epimerase [Halogranum salarium B-1]
MKVLVIGGSGFIGTNLSRELVDRGHDVTVLARNPEDDELPDSVKTVSGDVTDYDSIEGAFEGQNAVIFLVALSPLFKPKGGDQKHLEIHLGGTENAVKAAEAHDVKRFIQMSALGADPDGPTAYIRAKGQAENVVQASELKWTIFRPSVVFGEGGEFVSFTKKLAPPYVTPLPGGGKTRFQPIWVDDLVPMLADALDDDAHVGKTYEVGGPERLTLAEVAKLAHGADGRSVTVVPIPMGLAGVGLSIGGMLPGFPMGSDQYRSLKFDNTTSDNDVGAFDRAEADLKTLSTYLNQ